MAQSLRKTQNVTHEENDSWIVLKNAWRSYKMARMKDDKNKMIEYAAKIRSLQKNLGSKLSDFPELNS